MRRRDAAAAGGGAPRPRQAQRQRLYRAEPQAQAALLAAPQDHDLVVAAGGALRRPEHGAVRRRLAAALGALRRLVGQRQVIRVGVCMRPVVLEAPHGAAREGWRSRAEPRRPALARARAAAQRPRLIPRCASVRAHAPPRRGRPARAPGPCGQTAGPAAAPPPSRCASPPDALLSSLAARAGGGPRCCAMREWARRGGRRGGWLRPKRFYHSGANPPSECRCF